MKAHSPTYPTVRDGAVTVIGAAGYADQVFRDGTVITTHRGRHHQAYRPGDTSDFAVRARADAAQFYN
jgi:hypothetical protein